MQTFWSCFCGGVMKLYRDYSAGRLYSVVYSCGDGALVKSGVLVFTSSVPGVSVLPCLDVCFFFW